MAAATPVTISRLLLVVVWLFFIAACFGYVSRVLIKLRTSKWNIGARTADDWFLDAALLFALAQSIATSIQANSGFGDIFPGFDALQVAGIERAGYSADLFYVLAMSVAKLSGIAFCHGVTPVHAHKLCGKAIGAFVGAWTVSAFFTLAFRCDPPAVWNTTNGKCINLRAWWLYFEASNGAIEIAVAVYPLYIIARLRTSVHRRLRIALPFLSRMLVTCACFTKVRYLSAASGNPAIAPGWWSVIVCTQAILCTAILAACAVYINDLLDSMHSGFFEGADLRRQGQQSISLHYRNHVRSDESHKELTAVLQPPRDGFGSFPMTRPVHSFSPLAQSTRL